MRKRNNHLYFWVTAFVILITGLMSNSTFDVNIHDTYYIISHYHLAIPFVVFLTVIGFIHLALKNRNKDSFLNKLHTYLSIGCILFLLLIEIYFIFFIPINNFLLFDDLNNENIIVSVIVVLFFFVQIISLIILLINIVKNAIQPTTSK